MKRVMILVAASFCLLPFAQPSFTQRPVPAPTPDIDAKLAQYFEIFADIKTIHQRIDDAMAANGGIRPAHIVLVKTSAEQFVAHEMPSAFPTGVDAELVTYAGNSDVSRLETSVNHAQSKRR
jgi:hypothetical protein